MTESGRNGFGLVRCFIRGLKTVSCADMNGRVIVVQYFLNFVTPLSVNPHRELDGGGGSRKPPLYGGAMGRRRH